MKALVLCTNSDEAGAPIHVHTLVSSLRDQVEFLVVFGEEGPIAQKLRDQGIEVEIVPQMRSRISPLQDLAAYTTLARHVAAFRPDVIHAHSSKAGMLGRVLSLRYGIPCIFTVHGWGWRGFGALRGGLIYALEKLLSYAPRCRYIYVSRSVEHEARTLLGISEQRGRVIYNAVNDYEVHPEPPGPLRILMPARVTAAKDHQSLVQAFERLDFPAELWLCGMGTDADAFHAQVQQWAPSLHHLIRLLGTRSDVPLLLRDCQVFALISNFEALPLSIIEAMSAGRAIVASDVGGVSELIADHDTGLLVAKNDVEGIRQALSSLQDGETRRQLRMAARQRYQERHTSEQAAKTVLEYYEDAARTP